MKRYTRKIKQNTNNYCEYEVKEMPHNDLFGCEYKELELYADGDLTMAIDFLGDVETLLEKYHIKDLKHLEKVLANGVK